MGQRVADVVEHAARGAGSVVDLAPHCNYRRFVPRESFEVRLGGSFRRVGAAVRYATDELRSSTPKLRNGTSAKKASVSDHAA